MIRFVFPWKPPFYLLSINLIWQPHKPLIKPKNSPGKPSGPVFLWRPPPLAVRTLYRPPKLGRCMVGNLPLWSCLPTFLNTLFTALAQNTPIKQAIVSWQVTPKNPKSTFGHFFGLSVVSGVITTGAVALLCATILGFILPFELNPLILSMIVMTVSWGLLIAGHYKVLDNISKWIILALTVATILAVIIAGMSPKEVAPDFVPMSPWNLASLSFIIALMGWMPAPLEFSVITSVWTAKKNPHWPHKPFSRRGRF